MIYKYRSSRWMYMISCRAEVECWINRGNPRNDRRQARKQRRVACMSVGFSQASSSQLSSVNGTDM